jgi:4-diphosphocytidyl-2-C-methyl-D-erythritol kinase
VPSLEAAAAKVNLALHVRARMPSGWHRIETLFAFTRFGDSLEAEPADDWMLAVEGPFAAAAGPAPDNLVLRAARLFAEETGERARFAFRLEKRIPAAAGLGGGSADAAAALRLLARLTGRAAGQADLARIAARLGADLPACLVSGTCRGEGRGEILSWAAPVSGMPVLLVNPGVEVPTGPVFAAWDGHDRGPLDGGDTLKAAVAGRNDLEAPAIALAPVIAEVLEALGAMPGVRLARMSGSGATCLALFDRREERDRAAATLPAGWWRTATELL